MSDRYLPFSSDDLERDMQDRQSCRVCGRTCRSTVGVCRSPVCISALVERLEQQLAELREGIRKHIEEGYEPPPRGVPCSHGKHYYEDCIACGDEFLAALLQEPPHD